MRRDYTLTFYFFITFICCLPLSQIHAQGSIASDGGMVTITFDASTSGIINGSFDATDISTSPAAGDLDEDGVHIADDINDATPPAAAFGAGTTTNNFFRGTSSGGVTTSGVWAFDVDPSSTVNRAFGIQPSGSRWGDIPENDGGHVVFRFVNNSGVTLTAFRVQYEIYVLNNENRNSVIEAYLTNDVSTPSYGAVQNSHITPAAPDITPTWVNASSVDFSVTSGVNVPNGSSIYLRFYIFDGPDGMGTRDEFAIDDIKIIGASTPGGLNPCVDMAPPTITCPDPQTGVLDANCNFQVIDYTGLATTSDDCELAAPVMVTQSPAADQTFNGIGSTVVVLTATDGAGTTATCNMTLNLVDQTPPSAICESFVFNSAVDACGTEVALPDPIVSDNCDPNASGSYNPPSGSFFPVGVTTLTATVTDASGNSTTCSSTMTINDNVPPNAVCQNGTVQLDGSGNGSINSSALDGGSTDNCPGALSYIPTSFAFTCSDVGPNTVTVSVVDAASNSATCTAVVTVQDNIPPTAICQNATVVLSGTSATLSASQVNNGSTDNCPPAVSVAPTMFDCSDVGTNPVTLLVVETSGGTGFSTCVATVTVQDNTAPTASCQSATVQVGNTLMPSQVDNGSSDNCTNPPSLSVAPNTFGCGNVGSNTVTLTVDDNNGNASTCTAAVTVESNAPPTAVCANTTVNLDGGGNASIVGSDVDGGSSSVCSAVTLSVTPNSFTCSDVGPNTVTLTATDTGNSATSACTAVVTVEDPLSACCAGPVAMCNAVTVQLDNLGNGTTSASVVGAGSTAECGLASETVNPSDFDCDDVGPNTVTYTITDINGTSSSCTAVVTVEDNVAPVPTCVPATVQLDGNGDGTLAPSAIHGGSIEACGFLPLSAAPTSFDCDDEGTVTVTLTVSDVNGNSSTCTASVEVEDNVPPVAVCQDVTVNFNGENELVVPTTVWDDLSSADNCGATFLTSISPMSVTCDQLGSVIPVTVLINDGNGNEDDCTANVTVGGLPCGFMAADINCPDGSEASFDPNTETFTVTSEGCYDPNYYSNSDSHGFVGTELCGDGEIIAEITDVSGAGYAGISMREDLSAGSKMLQLGIDGVMLTKRELRQSTGGIAFNHLFQTQGKNWLRLTRAGNQFTAQHSLDGVNWSTIIITNIMMPSCIQVGLYMENNTPTGTTTGTFENVEIKPAIFPLTTPGVGADVANTVAREGIKVYPNPTLHEAFVDLTPLFGRQATIQIFNSAGQAVKQVEIDQVEMSVQRLDLRGYESGLYYLQVKTPELPVITRKLVVIGEH